MSTDSPKSDTARHDQLEAQVNLLLRRERELTDAQLRLEHAVERSVALQKIGQFLIASESREQALEYTAKSLVADMSFERSLVVLRNDVTLAVVASCGYSREGQASLQAPTTPEVLEKVFIAAREAKEGQLILGSESAERFDQNVMDVLGMSTFLVAPLVEGDTAIGFVAAGYSALKAPMYAETLWLSDRDALWFSALANQVSSMNINSKLIASLRERTDELHAEQARLHASIDSLSLGFVLIDAGGVMVLKNQALDTIVKGGQGPLVTVAGLAAALPNTDLIKGIEQVQRERAKLNMKSVDLGSRVLRVLLAPVVAQGAEDSPVLGVVILFEDITEETLLDRSKDEFFSIASHELRTPLTAIKGNSSMILNYYKEALKDPTMREMILDIHEASDRLIEIVNDFLDASRIEQGKMIYRKESFALDKVVESVFYEIGEVARQKGLYLRLANDVKTLETLPKAFGDENRTKQILYNLIGNAMKFTEHGGLAVQIDDEGDVLKVLVTDTGRGIPEAAQKLLFRKFQQASDSLLTRDTTRGTGLGLYIAKQMTEGMGGHMALEHSEVGVGTVFSVTIPKADDTKSRPV
jgi:signal transduction histidine kinase